MATKPKQPGEKGKVGVKIPKTQRNLYYKEAMASVGYNYGNSICPVLCRHPCVELFNVHIYFPEFYAKKPKGKKTTHDYWFPLSKHGQKKRIKLLQQCIKETQRKNHSQ